jgi:hypothetical protein
MAWKLLARKDENLVLEWRRSLGKMARRPGSILINYA